MDAGSSSPPTAASSPPSRAALLRHAIQHAAHQLPAQAPLEVFVHHNTLHAFADLPFFDAVVAAQKTLGVRCLLREEQYREAQARGRIRTEDIDAVLHESSQLTDEASDLLPDWPASFPAPAALRRLLILHGIADLPDAALAFRIAEQHLHERLLPGLPPAALAKLFPAAPSTAQPGPPSLAAQRAVLAPLWQVCLRLGQAVPRTMAAGDETPFLRDLLYQKTNEDPDDLVHPTLIPLCGAFLDHGQAYLGMPDREKGFYIAWRQVLTAGHAIRPAWERMLGRLLRQDTTSDPEKTLLFLLDELKISDAELPDFVAHILRQLPGWAGMFHRIESAGSDVGLASRPPTVALLDFLAVRLTLDVLAYRDVAERAGLPTDLSVLRAQLLAERDTSPVSSSLSSAHHLFQLAQLAGLTPDELSQAGPAGARALLALSAKTGPAVRRRILHQAYERAYRDPLLVALRDNRQRLPEPPQATLALVTCIDDREESLRRHLEERHPSVQTFAAAGFFNLAIAFQGLDDPSTFPLCPVVVRPQHLIVEAPDEADAHLHKRRHQRRKRLGQLRLLHHEASRSFWLAPLVTALSAFTSAIPLLLRVFAPLSAKRLQRAITRRLLPQVRTQLAASRDDESRALATDGLFQGFSFDEMAARVGALLENIGLVRHFPPLVVILGHDSTSVNNPHIAAYSCGACGGRSGGPNARLFARMANHPSVRALLLARHIDIPPSTQFLGALHDTASDSVEIYEDDLSEATSAALPALRRILRDGLTHSAHERSRRFVSASPHLAPAAALDHVEHRAADLGQARPELGHATNASCIVGRRSLSRGVFLDRRAFLVSYDPTIDPHGTILERILLAVGPVGAGINLEYFFSTVDNERLGAGTKLPHNVVGLLGVMNGASSDLRTGLPKQMIEIHEPIRLQLILDADPAIAGAILDRQPPLQALVCNEWLTLIVLDPSSGATLIYRPGLGLVPWQPSTPSLHVSHVPRSVDHYRGQRDHLPPALLSMSHPVGDRA